MTQVHTRTVMVHDLLFAEQAAHEATKAKLKEARAELAATRLQLTAVSRRLGEKRAEARSEQQ
jgi:hypothetical protein